MNPTPTGRAGRALLRRRLDAASRARGTLEVKLSRLQEEQTRLRAALDELTARWRDEVERGERWLLRALLQGGRQGLDLASPAGPAEVTVRWTSTMGVRHPGSAEYRPPAADAARVDTGTAVAHARAAYRAAAATGVQVATAAAAVDALAAEAAATRRRLRALDRRVLPQLRTALARLELDLEERDREERAGRRLRSSPGTGGDPPTSTPATG